MQSGDEGRAVKLTINQERVLAAVRRWKTHEQCGATVLELHRHFRLSLSGDAIRSNLVKLRRLGLVWSYGSSMTNATCWHPDPPPVTAGRAALSSSEAPHDR